MMALRTNSAPLYLDKGAQPRNVLKDKWWFAPLAALYKLGVRFRHRAYDVGVIPSKPGSLPSVVLGNVTVGGTGKTPHLKALLQQLMDQSKETRWAVLSRGYGRKSKGFLRVDREGTPEEFGDEPLEVARRYPGIPVFVCEDRLNGLEEIAKTGLADAVILDDGLQHRRLRPTVGIMLVDTTQPVDRDHFLPRGRLRDLPSRVAESDAVILTRCPAPMTKGDLRLWRHRLGLKAHQHLLHTGARPDGLRAMATKRYAAWPSSCVAVSGIANPIQFEDHLSKNCKVAQHFSYADHYAFAAADLSEWKAALQATPESGVKPEAIITTEKDAERIRPLAEAAELPILVVGLQIQWWDEEALSDLFTTLKNRVEASSSDSDI